MGAFHSDRRQRGSRQRRFGLEYLERRELLASHSSTDCQMWMASFDPAPPSDPARAIVETAALSAESLAPTGETRVLANKTQRWQQTDRIGGGDWQDAYRLELSEASQIQLDVSGQRVPVQVTVTDAKGRTLANRLAYDRTGILLSGNLTAGSYVITISARSSWNTAYTLTLDVTARAPATNPSPNPSQPSSNTPSPSTSPRVPTTPPTTVPQVFPDVANYGGANEWNLNAINAPESWSQGFAGRGVVVAVVDTGVDWSHPDLQHAVWTNSDEIAGDGIDNDRNGYVDDVRGWDFVSSDNNPLDQNGHGTHVAGTIVAARNDTGATGVAYQAQVMPVRVLGANGSGTDYAVAQGIRYAVDNGADIINLSLGSNSLSNSLSSALAYAASKDVLIVAAAGNESAGAPSSPARFSSQWTNIISVGAHDRSNGPAGFSNEVGNIGAVQVAAPGVDIYSTLPNGRYGRLNGTSMAAPHVAGMAALALSANPQLTSSQLRGLLTSGANRGVTGARNVGPGVNAAVSVAQARRLA